MTDEKKPTEDEETVETEAPETAAAAEPEVDAPAEAEETAEAPVAEAEETPVAEADEAEADEADDADEDDDAEADAEADEADDADEDDDAEAEAEATEEPAKLSRGQRRRARRRGDAASSETPAPAAPEKPAPTRRRARRDPNAPAPVVRAQAKYVRSSARKARLVCDNIRGKSVEEARAILLHTPRHVARDWSKLLESAVANAENNHDLDGEDLLIKSVTADEGPTIKRFQPRAMGRATKIRKRTAHLTILLTPKD